MTGALIGTVKDTQGGVVPGAIVRVSSPALIGGSTTAHHQRERAAALPGSASRASTCSTSSSGIQGLSRSKHPHRSRRHDRENGDPQPGGHRGIVGCRGSGLAYRSARERIRDALRAGGSSRRFRSDDSACSTSSGPPLACRPRRREACTTNSVSAFGSGANENTFLIDGTNFTCPCSGEARSEPGVDFIQEVQVQSVGASAEFGYMQGAVINAITRQGSDRFLYDASYYGQTASVTSQPVHLPYSGRRRTDKRLRAGQVPRLHDESRRSCRSRSALVLCRISVPSRLRQPARDRPGVPEEPTSRTRSSRSSPGGLLPACNCFRASTTSSGSIPELPTLVKPFEATQRRHASVPAMTFGHLTHTLSSNTVWDVRVGRFVYVREDDPSTGSLTTPSRFERATGVFSGAPQTFGGLTLIRTTAKATLNHYRPGLLGADHQWRIGGQIERGEHHLSTIIPTGVRYVDNNGTLFQTISSDPSIAGGVFITAAGFVSDAITVGTFAHDQCRPALRSQSRHQSGPAGPRFGRARNRRHRPRPRHAVHVERVVAAPWRHHEAHWRRPNDAACELRQIQPGRAHRRARPVPPGGDVDHDGHLRSRRLATPRRVVGVDPEENLRLDPETRTPRTDEYSIGVDREVGRRLARGHRLRSQGWRQFHRLDGCRRSISGGDAAVARRSQPAGVRARQLHGRSSLSVDQSRRILAHIQRARDGRRKTAVQRMASVRVLYILEGLRTAGVERGNRRRRRRSARSPASRTSRSDRTRTSSRTRAAGCQTIDRTWCESWAASTCPDGVRRCRQCAAFERQAVGGDDAVRFRRATSASCSSRAAPGGSRRRRSWICVCRGRSASADRRASSCSWTCSTCSTTRRKRVWRTTTLFARNFGQPSVFMDPRRAMLGVRLNLGR